MQSLFLSGRVLPFGAKLSVTHVFRSSEKSPLEVVYCFPLPRDASLVSFQISGESFSISSRLERAADAQKRYEQALEDGSLAALTQQNLRWTRKLDGWQSPARLRQSRFAWISSPVSH